MKGVMQLPFINNELHAHYARSSRFFQSLQPMLCIDAKFRGLRNSWLAAAGLQQSLPARYLALIFGQIYTQLLPFAFIAGLGPRVRNSVATKQSLANWGNRTPLA